MEDTMLVMLKTVTRSMFSKSACKMYPLREPVFYERTRGRIEIDPSKCTVCTLCAKRCPTGAVFVDRKENRWQIDRFKCILCNACTEACKAKALTMVKHYTGPMTRNQIEIYRVTPPKKRQKKTDDSHPFSSE